MNKFMVLTIIIPMTRPPNKNSRVIVQINDVLKEISQYDAISVVWVMFQPTSSSILVKNNHKIINFNDYSNALEIIDEFQPHLILTEGGTKISSFIFATLGKYRKIPVVTLFTMFGNRKTMSSIISRLRLMSGSRIIGDIDEKSEPLKSPKFVLKKYLYLISSLRKTKYPLNHVISLLISYPVSILFSRNQRPIHVEACGDLNFCNTAQGAQRLENLGVDSSRIKVVGDPFFDHIFWKIKDYKHNTSSNNQTKILFCTSTLHEHGLITKKTEDLIIKNVVNTLQKNNFDIDLKIHPSSSILLEYQTLSNSFLKKIKIFQKEKLEELIQNYDVLISYGGTTANVYGILLRIPTIFLQIKELSSWNYFFDEKMMYSCKQIDELPKILNEIKSFDFPDNEYENYIKRILGKFDGKCSQRIATHIIELINQKHNTSS